MSDTRVSSGWALALLLLVAAPLGARAGASAGVLPPAFAWSLGGGSNPRLDPVGVPPGAPVRIEIPDIGVAAPVTPVDLQRDGSLQVPAPDAVGWYRRTPVPGGRGSAVLAGHVDTHSAPAVFARLSELEAGDRIGVADADGHATVFEVRAVTRHDKDQLPADFWRPDPRRLLRLVTCGGAFDRSRRSYAENVVVHAVALGRWTPSAGQTLVP